MGWDLSVLCRVVLRWGKKFGSPSPALTSCWKGKALGKVHLSSGGKVLTRGLPVSTCPAKGGMSHPERACAVCHGALYILQLRDAGVRVPWNKVSSQQTAVTLLEGFGDIFFPTFMPRLLNFCLLILKYLTLGPSTHCIPLPG